MEVRIIFALAILTIIGCAQPVEHTARAIEEKDSVSMMKSYGVSTMISDSGVMKYRLITEEWEVNTVRNPQRWIFNKGLFMIQFDDKFHASSRISADTAYYYNEQKLWELKGRVQIITADGLLFKSEQLFWDQQKHELYSNVYSYLDTPERTMEGNYFRSDERMTKYYVSNSRGSFEQGAMMGNDKSEKENNDTVPAYVRPAASPHPHR